ncbi:YidH family protein [Gordonia insulae]|uniref:Inner membrane protein YidH n=1 Tax=Gordonia insulae TaxID=2420509 RepID=A0A3G8JRG7_9ACTN|nr:DUF202 domain-containing protein [Gordonia insulae]AZG47315.1 Inner membrane protein YidH [Gordonia insulae]
MIRWRSIGGYGSLVVMEISEPDYRFTLANERTFLAWQRTSLGLLAAAVAVLQFLPEDTHPAVRYGVGGLLGALSVATSVGGLARWRGNDDAIRRDQPLPRPRLIAYVASVLAVVGVIAIILALAPVLGVR